jgi:hypothetical protein
MGWLPWGARPGQERELVLTTRRKTVLQAIGATVYLIARLPRPARYVLWETFTIAHVEAREDQFVAWGPGQQLLPPVTLNGPDFDTFHRACAYFVGFQPIDRQPYLATLRAAVQANPTEATPEAAVFCTALITSFPRNGDVRYYRAAVHHQLGHPELAHFDAVEALRLGTEYEAAARALLLPSLLAADREGSWHVHASASASGR